MKQVVQSYRTGEISVEEVPVPECRRDGILVRTSYSLISTGTERAITALGRKSLLGKANARPDLVKRALAKARREGYWKTFQEALDRVDTPTALGYSAAGIVVDVGSQVDEFSVGDRVACMGTGFASHAEVLSMPRNLCVKVPTHVGLDEAAFGTVGTIALHGIRLSDAQLGSRVGVIGLGLLGLLSVELLKATGCKVFACDLNGAKVELARSLGVDVAVRGGDSSVSVRATYFSDGYGLDAVIIAASAKDSRPIELAAEMCRVCGKIILVGVANIEIPRQLLWEKEIEFKVSKAGGPGALDPLYELEGVDYPYPYVRWTQQRNLEAILDFLATRRIDVRPLITHRFEIGDALKAYDCLMSPGSATTIGVLLHYPGTCEVTHVLPLRPLLKARIRQDRIKVGVIGAGLFAKSLFLPKLKKLPDVKLEWVATANGISANHARKRFGFEYCTTDYRTLLDDKAVQAVFILTRHSLHATIVVEALVAGKHVFVEKPLCVNEEELAKITAAYDAAPHSCLMVGYNRRFAPLAIRLKSTLGHHDGPLALAWRVNVGRLSLDHWVNDPAEGGGRVVGELCHFVDFCEYLTNSVPHSVYASSISSTRAGSENVNVSLKFQDGSIADIVYTASGDRAFSRERLEVFSDGSVGVLEDFRRLELVVGGKTRTHRLWSQDLGYAGELTAFIRAIRDGGESPISFEQAAASSLATFRILESVKTGLPVRLDKTGPTRSHLSEA